MKYLKTYHNDNTKVAYWETEKYNFRCEGDPYKFQVMKETNTALRDPYYTEDIVEGIRLMLAYDGVKNN